MATKVAKTFRSLRTFNYRENAKKYRKLLPFAPAAVVVLGFAITGIILTVASRAATYTAPKEAEAGAVAGLASAKANAQASGGSYVNFGTAGTTPPPTTPPPTTPPAAGPSGVAVPIGDIPGWKQVFVDDFTKDAPTGSWATTDADKIIYTGDHGGKWSTYADGWSSTYTGGTPAYSPSTVLSVHDSVLDFHLHDEDGNPQGSNPSPYVAGSSNYQTYGRYSARFKSDKLSNYYAAWLLWPESDGDYQCAESDFPEGSLDGGVGGFAHYGCGGDQDSIGGGGAKYSDWHTYTQEWSPGSRKYYVDDKLVGQSSSQVWSKPQRWQLQTEVNGGSGEDGHLLVDWVVAYSYKP